MKLTRLFLSCIAISVIVPAYADDPNDFKARAAAAAKPHPDTNAGQTQRPAVPQFNREQFHPLAPNPNINSNNNFNNHNQASPQIQNQLSNQAARPQFHQPQTTMPAVRGFAGSQPNDPRWGHPANPTNPVTVSLANNAQINGTHAWTPNSAQQGQAGLSWSNHAGGQQGVQHVTNTNIGNVNNNSSHGDHFNGNRGWVSHYRMPYVHGDTGHYDIHYARSWPANYGWRAHGWHENYQAADPYWFALITSIAISQAWSDEEVTEAINDENLRAQLLYDDDIRQQMIESGYPADQVDYPPAGDSYSNGGDPNAYPPADAGVPPDYNQGYNPNYNQAQQGQGAYYPPANQPPPNQPAPNSGLPSGDQVANLNANKNALYFCSSGNQQQAAQAFSQIQSPDMTVWPTMDYFNQCEAWAVGQ